MTINRLIPDLESLLEAGLVLMAVGCLGGLAVLALGRAAGSVRRAQSHGVPARGSVPVERHHNTGAVSAR